MKKELKDRLAVLIISLVVAIFISGFVGIFFK